MTMALVETVEVDQTERIKGGLLDVAHPAPAGWERGLLLPFYGCGEPKLQDNCFTSMDTPHRRGEAARFDSFAIQQGSECATLPGLDQSVQAQGRLESTSEWALGQQLQLGVVNVSNPNLGDADVLGTIADADFVHAVSCLEQAAADAGFGAEWFLHAPVRAAAYLKRLKMLDDGLSPSGAPWVISPGYQPQGATTVRLWATGPVWVGTDEPRNLQALNRRTNTDTAYAVRQGLVAFDPCINIAMDVTVPACPV